MAKKKNQKPIEVDAHLKYRCESCSSDHWLSLKQSQTKNFKVVCYCGKVFRPKQISRIKILYKSKIKKQKATAKPVQNIPNDLLQKCCKILENYGFDLNQCKKILNDSYTNNPTNDYVTLIKQSLASLQKE
jgi:DUF1009 family protein